MSDKDIKDPSVNPDVNKDWQDNPDVNKDKKDESLTAEEIAKLKQHKDNLDKALKQEREYRKAKEAELEELRKFKSDLEEKEKIKKGKLEELLAEKEKIIEELSVKAKSFDELMEKKQAEIKSKLEELTWKLSEDELADNKDILEDLSDENKIKYLERILNTNQKKDFNPETKDKKEKATDLQILEEKLSKWVKLSPTERANYLTLLRQEAK